MIRTHIHRPLRSLRLSIRFVLPLSIALALLAYLVVPLFDGLTLRWFARDLQIRSQLISTTLQDPLVELLDKESLRHKITPLLERIIKDERLLAVGICSPARRLIYKTRTFPAALTCSSIFRDSEQQPKLISLPQGKIQIFTTLLSHDNKDLGSLILIHDISYIERRSSDTRKYLIGLFVVLGAVISLITVLVAHLSWQGWIEGVRALIRGEGILKPFQQPATSEVQPLVGEMRTLLRSLEVERRYADDHTTTWDPAALRSLLHSHFPGDQVIVISNREPYIHEKDGDTIIVHRPASGLVTAVEPVMRACSGTWIAHGSGSADSITVDQHDRVGVPPTHPEYQLRRLWFTPQEEQGYYFGFSNEGLWPLCHNAHVRPVFRDNDWNYYKAINKRFADAVVEEARCDDPVVLVQDYHFSLVPALIRKKLPKATIITFWHIPWPNAESFGICPWREELLQGILGSTIIGFHTPFHSKNFLETVNRYLETRIEYETSTIFYRGHLSMVENYPISIQWPTHKQTESTSTIRNMILSELNLPSDQLIGLGVDRMDYTKGILERFSAVEWMLENHSELVGRFSFIQIAAPSRTALEEYKNFENRVQNMAERINSKFPNAIILKAQHHEPEDVARYYRACHVCMVTSLHDGMNLVAKEFIAARDDEQGVLVLSQFTGAANELHESLIVNPYHVEQTATALYRGLNMPLYEQQERMKSMRSLIKDFNVYRWAGRMLLDAARVRQRQQLATRIGKQA